MEACSQWTGPTSLLYDAAVGVIKGAPKFRTWAHLHLLLSPSCVNPEVNDSPLHRPGRRVSGGANPSQILPESSGSFPNPSWILLPESFFTNPSRILLLPQTPENFTTLPSNHGDLRICAEICEDLRSDLNKMALVPVWRYYRDFESLYISYCEWIPNHGNIDNYGPNTGCYLTQPFDWPSTITYT